MTTATYTSRSLKGTALLTETSVLLRAWRPGETGVELRRRVLAEDLLGKSTSKRAEDVVDFVFARRFLGPGGSPAVHLQRILAARSGGEWLTHVSLVLSARQDDVLRDAITLSLPRARAGHVGNDDILRLLDEAAEDGRLSRPWSSTVRLRVTQHILRQMSEFGLLKPPSRGMREVVHFRPDPVAVAWLACDLHFAGTSDGSLPGHPDWAILRLREPEVREQLAWIGDHGLWTLQAAGEVVRMDWHVPSMTEAANVLARINLR
ncbi:MAG: BrxA family protein [Myxococcota bacterium]